MVWKLIQDNETVGEWSDDLVDKVVKELMIDKKKKSSISKSKNFQDEGIQIVAEFLPDPIREALLNIQR